jgi:hypothetical protein
MKSNAYKSLLALCAFAILGVATSAHAQTIRWAGTVDALGYENILHAPDDRYLGLGRFTRPGVTLGGFNPVSGVFVGTMRYPGLARLLGVSESTLSRASVIAFEANGGSGAGVDLGWESSKCTFSDGVNVRRVSFNERVGAYPHPGSDPAVIATGSIRNIAYSAFFGMCSSDPAGPVTSYILFDLHSGSPVINTTSASFSIRLEAHDGDPTTFGEGSPDPDAVGIFVSCRSS